MAVIRNTAAMRLSGSIGNTTYYTQGRRQLARVSQNSSNYGESARRTEKQQRRRVLFSNLVNFYKTSANWMHGAFESKLPNQSDYNKFMQVNLPSTRVALNKDQALQGCSVYDSYIISQGSMKSISLTRSENTVTTDLSYTETAEVIAAESLGHFSALLIANNPWLYNGCQLSFLIYTLDFKGPRLPELRMSRAELTLDDTSPEPMSKFSITPYLSSAGGKLTWNSLSPDDYVAIILSDSTSGKLLVSTQRLVPGDVETVDSYATEAVVQAAIDSYGVDPVYFLESGDM